MVGRSAGMVCRGNILGRSVGAVVGRGGVNRFLLLAGFTIVLCCSPWLVVAVVMVWGGVLGLKVWADGLGWIVGLGVGSYGWADGRGWIVGAYVWGWVLGLVLGLVLVGFGFQSNGRGFSIKRRDIYRDKQPDGLRDCSAVFCSVLPGWSAEFVVIRCRLSGRLCGLRCVCDGERNLI